MFEIQHHATKSARWWYKNRAEIDMEPEYQRSGGIWSDEDRRFLIDSIINDYDIPKLYLTDFSTGISELNTERKRYAVIDGKQRLESIFQFFDGELSLSKNFVYAANNKLQLSGMRFNDLEARFPAIASKIEEFPLAVVFVVTNEPSRINELFVRLNKGLKLTGAELRNAMIGPVPKIIRQIVRHEFFSNRISYTDKRGQSLNVAAKLLAFEIEEKIVDTKKSLLDKLVSTYATKKLSDLQVYSDAVKSNLDRMEKVFSKDDELLSSQGVIPDYYLLIESVHTRHLKLVRGFLVEFMNAVKTQRNLDAGRRNRLVAEFIIASRNRNDSKFIEKRVDILLELFEHYINAGMRLRFS